MYEYYDLDNLPVLKSGVRSLQTSSYDRKYENADFGQYLYEEGDEYVLFDERGAGCIKSIWMAVTSDETLLHFYFDGEETARWNTTSKKLFNNDIPELSGLGNTFELRGHYEEDDCHAGNLFIQIPFENGLKITASGEKKVYYHILYETCEDGEKAVGNSTFENLERAFAGERREHECGKIEKDLTLKVGYTDLFTSEESGVIRKFTLTADADTDLSEVYIDMVFDGHRASDVACPILHLFAQPLGFTEISSYAVESHKAGSKQVMTLYLPIPYWEKTSMCFVNWSDAPIDVSVELDIGENTYDKNSAGYFSADHEAGKTQLFSDWHLGRFPGRGHLVGIVQTCIGGQYCEGNEHFYINGSVTPQINGTGTEDLYLGCYWPNFKYDSPLAGCVNDVYIENGSTLSGAMKTPAGYYRYFLDMPIEYENGIVLDIQHGAVCQTYSKYTSTCFSYKIHEPALFETDIIDLSSYASMAVHCYQSDGVEYTHTAKIESDMSFRSLTRTGYKTENGGVSFTVSLREKNRGAVLRRLYDKTVSNKGAQVYIDGEFAGIWNTPGENPDFGFADDDFYIPASFTDGKGEISVEIRSGGFYSDFEYRVFTRVL